MVKRIWLSEAQAELLDTRVEDCSHRRDCLRWVGKHRGSIGKLYCIMCETSFSILGHTDASVTDEETARGINNDRSRERDNRK